MKSDKRRQEILSLLGNTENAIPANVLSEKFGVSRQVIVQDIA
ncbi:MAG: HTH domain-containing protein, partial [Clostridia bacterium]|nr:HTH domain-containing protein [Clostridia bacterium]